MLVQGGFIISVGSNFFWIFSVNTKSDMSQLLQNRVLYVLVRSQSKDIHNFVLYMKNHEHPDVQVHTCTVYIKKYQWICIKSYIRSSGPPMDHLKVKNKITNKLIKVDFLCIFGISSFLRWSECSGVNKLSWVGWSRWVRWTEWGEVSEVSAVSWVSCGEVSWGERGKGIALSEVGEVSWVRWTGWLAEYSEVSVVS